eukprot:1395886-Alexandrium_andersonii.AAC.1
MIVAIVPMWSRRWQISGGLWVLCWVTVGGRSLGALWGGCFGALGLLWLVEDPPAQAAWGDAPGLGG